MSIKKIKYSWPELMNIEGVLNKIIFNGIPLGGLFANTLYSTLYQHGFDFTASNKLNIWYQYFKLYILCIFNFKKRRPFTQKKYIYNYTVNLERYTEFFMPTLKYINPDDVLFVSARRQQLKANPELDFYTPPYLNLGDFLKWRREFSDVFRQFNNLESELKKKFNVSGYLFFHLKVILLYQSQRMYLMLRMLEETTPHKVLTDHDRQAVNSALIIAAKIKKIQNYTLIHGSTDPEANFLPLIADHMLCWGQKHVNQFSNFGISKEQLIIVGNSKLTLKPLPQPDSGTFVITLVSNPIDIEEVLILANIFAGAIQNIASGKEANIRGIIKLHPSEDKAAYASIINNYPKVEVLTSAEISNAEIFSQSLVIVSHNSTMAFDALTVGKSVIILNPKNVFFPLGIGRELVDYAGCAEALNEAQLEEAILKEIDNAKNNVHNDGLAAAYINYYCQYWGDDATQKLVDILTQK